MDALVSESGRVLCARALSGHPLLRPAAIAAAQQMTFEPVSEAGTPVENLGLVVFSFRRIDELVTADGATGSSTD